MRHFSDARRTKLIIGILLIILGVFTFIRPGSMLTGIIVIYGIAAIITGIMDIVNYIRINRYTGFAPMLSLISGILSTMCGFMLLVSPGTGRWILAFLLPIWFIAHCISRLSNLHLARAIRGDVYYYICMIICIIGIVFGFLMLMFPVLSFLTMDFLAYLAAFYLILLGIDCILDSFERR